MSLLEKARKAPEGRKASLTDEVVLERAELAVAVLLGEIGQGQAASALGCTSSTVWHRLAPALSEAIRRGQYELKVCE